MARILYCNLRDKWTIEGHKYFDVKCANLLGNVGEVDLLSPEESWYHGESKNVHTITYAPNDEINKKYIPNMKIWNRGFLKRFAVRSHSLNMQIMKFVQGLDKENRYDYIVISTLDIMVFPFFFKRFGNTDRIFLIEHQCGFYNKKVWRFLFDIFKNNIQHIVMENDAIGYLHNQYDVKTSRLHYIPHMLNPVKILENTGITLYDVVGISNSNSEEEISALVDHEKTSGFFHKSKIRALFRSKTIEFSNGWMKVIKGRLGLSYEEYYGYVASAKVMILPFNCEFGLRTSGTILDAFSQNIPVIGTDFLTLKQYHKRFPNICKIYYSMDDLNALILEAINNPSDYADEFNRFCEERTDDAIKRILCKLFI